MNNVEALDKPSVNSTNRRYGIEKYILGLFLLWPFAALFQAIRHYRAYWAKNIVWLYFIFFGFTYVIYSLGNDASGYRDSLVMMADAEFTLSSLFSSYLAPDSKVLDIAQRLITLIVSLFTSDYRFLFAVFCIFMGYFLSRIIWYLIDSTTGRIGLFASLILISYSLVVGIWDIGGIRWNISAVIFIYGLLIYFFENKKRAYWIIGSTIFIHWSFPLAISIFLIYKILGNRSLAYFILFALSFFIAQIDLEIVRNLFYSYAPGPVLESRSSYLSEYYVKAVGEGLRATAWYLWGHTLALKWFVFAFVIYIFIFNRKLLIKIPPLNGLFNFGMLFYGVFNILSSIPSVARFFAVGNLIMLGILFLLVQKYRMNYPKWLELIGFPVLLLFIIVRIRIGLDYTGLWTIIGNPIIVYFAENDYALIDLIKRII